MGLRDERLKDEHLKDYRPRPSRGVFGGNFESLLAQAGVQILNGNEEDYEGNQKDKS